MEKIGIFEVDCRERAEDGGDLSFVPRAVRFMDDIEKIYRYAEERNLPIVFTTCCADRLLKKGNSAGALVVPMDPADTEWKKDLAKTKSIYLEKTTWGSPAQNNLHCAWDMFKHNANADGLFKDLHVDRWIVYGVGIDLCVNSAVKGLINAGCKVTILSDILVNNAGGTPETMTQILGRLCDQGATTQTLAEFLAQ